MSHRDDLARGAVIAALELRSRRGRSPEQPLCPVDVALEDGVDVRFEPIKSLEGMYAPEGPLIIVGSLRPRGRQSYTCAHELGHHVFAHGLRIDELLEDSSRRDVDDAEYVANRFAAALLMPKLAVLHAFAVRGWKIGTSTPTQIYTIAGLFGVGYTTLIGYLERTLRELASSAARQLRKVSPKRIRAGVLGADAPDGLVMVDEFWRGRPVDVEVGDAVMIPRGASADADVVERIGDGLLRARAPGIACLRRDGWHVDLRIMRAAYAGLAVYRYLEDADDDE